MDIFPCRHGTVAFIHDAQVGKVDLAPRGYRRQLHILTASDRGRHFLPIRNVMPCPRLHPPLPDALCPESVVTQ